MHFEITLVMRRINTSLKSRLMPVTFCNPAKKTRINRWKGRN